ncbi:MAG: MarR family transcriptional regulator [Microbacteriaceae bacterium]|nr:MarR family transcriptional regulator [Microbacteriaceae bacterium]
MPPAKRTAVDAWEALFRAQVSILRDITADFPEPLTIVEYDVLFNLSRLPNHSARPRDLTPLLLLSQPSVSRMIDRLAERGLVTKHPDPDDGRGIMVRLTDDGYELFRRVAAVHSDSIARRFGDRLSEEELRTLITLCDRLRIGGGDSAPA